MEKKIILTTPNVHEKIRSPSLQISDIPNQKYMNITERVTAITLRLITILQHQFTKRGCC